jgi:hypothetical protein
VSRRRGGASRKTTGRDTQQKQRKRSSRTGRRAGGAGGRWVYGPETEGRESKSACHVTGPEKRRKDKSSLIRLATPP